MTNSIAMAVIAAKVLINVELERASTLFSPF